MADQPLSPFLRQSFTLCRGSLFAVAAFSCFINLLMLAVPLYILQIYNRIIPNHSTDTLIFLTLIVIVALLTLGALDALRGFVLTQLGGWLDQRLSGHVLSGAIARTLRKRSGSSVQDLHDLATLRNFFSSSSLTPILDTPWTPIFIAVLFMLHPWLGLLTLATALLLLGLAFLNEVLTRRYAKQASEATGKAHDFAGAIIRNADAIEAMGMRSNLIRLWGAKNAAALALHTRANARGGWVSALAKFIRLLAQVSLLGMAAWLVLQQQMSAGAMVAGVLLMRRAIAPMERAISSWKRVLDVRHALGRVNRRLAEAPTLAPRAILPRPSGGLSVAKLTFRYPQRSGSTLDRISFELEPGQALGLIGATAAGKSTLSRLLVGNAAPSSGHVRLGGIDITRWDAQARGPFIGYLPQNVELFAGTVRQNIARMGAGDTDAVIEAAQLAGVHEMILQFPQGYDTEIGEDGATLSGGQRQRIALARAVYGKPKLIVLDEPDANLDREGRKALLKALEELKRHGAMIVLITHHPEMLKHVEQVFILQKGKLQPADDTDAAPAPEQAQAADSGAHLNG